ncbi:hypothetical protein ABZ235_04405 [Streptomyces canus]|uniref:hypothetical protein n=1 Tax=Streptomyces canus TaxID=58343 RepID=UPI0033B48341
MSDGYQVDPEAMERITRGINQAMAELSSENGGYQLPQFDSEGNSIRYTEWGNALCGAIPLRGFV